VSWRWRVILLWAFLTAGGLVVYVSGVEDTPGPTPGLWWGAVAIVAAILILIAAVLWQTNRDFHA